MRVIAVSNMKGGVAKTTTVNSIATYLGILGKKVLVMDGDPQATLTYSVLGEREFKKSIGNILLTDEHIEDIIVESKYFDLVPSSLYLTVLEPQLMSKYGRELLLKNKIKKMTKKYDFIIIDCAPALSTITVNALVAADDIYIPCECELFSLDGLRLMEDILETDIKPLKENLKEAIIIPTKLDKVRKISKEAYHIMSQSYPVTNPIHKNSKVGMVGLDQLSIFEIDGKSSGALDYKELVEKYILGGK